MQKIQSFLKHNAMAANTFIPTWLHRTVTVAHFLNCFIVAATFIGYAIVDGGGIGIQFFLGCYQLAVAVVATYAYWRWKTPQPYRLLKRYWAFVLVWIVCATAMALAVNTTGYVEVGSSIRLVAIGIGIILPMLIAIYFVYVTYRIYSDFNQTES